MRGEKGLEFADDRCNSVGVLILPRRMAFAINTDRARQQRNMEARLSERLSARREGRKQRLRDAGVKEIVVTTVQTTTTRLLLAADGDDDGGGGGGVVGAVPAPAAMGLRAAPGPRGGGMKRRGTRQFNERIVEDDGQQQ